MLTPNGLPTKIAPMSTAAIYARYSTVRMADSAPDLRIFDDDAWRAVRARIGRTVDGRRNTRNERSSAEPLSARSRRKAAA